jgi:hypothetical protein
MKLKRFYKSDGTLDYVSCADTGTTPEQNFSVDLVVGAMEQGWMSLEGNQLLVSVEPEVLRYEVLRQPGRYCCHCDEKLQDDEKGNLARLHVASKHRGQASPDPNSPAGYVKLNHFACRLNAEQHERFRVKNVGRAPVYPERKETVNG